LKTVKQEAVVNWRNAPHSLQIAEQEAQLSQRPLGGFLSLNILQSYSRSLKIIQTGTIPIRVA